MLSSMNVRPYIDAFFSRPKRDNLNERLINEPQEEDDITLEQAYFAPESDSLSNMMIKGVNQLISASFGVVHAIAFEQISNSIMPEEAMVAFRFLSPAAAVGSLVYMSLNYDRMSQAERMAQWVGVSSSLLVFSATLTGTAQPMVVGLGAAIGAELLHAGNVIYHSPQKCESFFDVTKIGASILSKVTASTVLAYGGVGAILEEIKLGNRIPRLASDFAIASSSAAIFEVIVQLGKFHYLSTRGAQLEVSRDLIAAAV